MEAFGHESVEVSGLGLARCKALCAMSLKSLACCFKINNENFDGTISQPKVPEEQPATEVQVDCQHTPQPQTVTPRVGREVERCQGPGSTFEFLTATHEDFEKYLKPDGVNLTPHCRIFEVNRFTTLCVPNAWSIGRNQGMLA